MKYKVQYGSEVICLPGKVMDCLSGTTEKELTVLIYMLSKISSGQELSISAAASDLNCDESTISHAIAYWKGAGLVCESQTQIRDKVSVKESKGENGSSVISVNADSGPHYTGEEIKKLFEADRELSGFVDSVSRTLEKMFTPHEINKLLSLHEYHGLDCEYIVMLAGYCKRIDRASVPYLEKTAKNLADEGITTLSALEGKLLYLERIYGLEGVVRKLLGTGGRTFTKKEKKFLENWAELDFDESVIELAYEVTVDNAHSPSLPYMNRVLTNWSNAGYKTTEDVFVGMEEYKAKKEAQQSSGKGSFETDEFFEAALKASLKKHQESSDEV